MPGTRVGAGGPLELCPSPSEGFVDEVGAVEVEAVEEERSQPEDPALVVLTAESRHHVLEEVRILALGGRADDLGVEDGGLERQCPDQLDHLGEAGGHVVEVAGVEADLGPDPVDLQPDAVQLPLHRGGPVHRAQRVRHRRRGRRQHRGQGSQHFQADAPEAVGPIGQGHPGDLAEVARQQDRPPHQAGGDLGGAGDRVRQDAGQRALPQLAGEEATEELRLRAGGSPEQPTEDLVAARGRAGAGGGLDPGDRRIELGHGQRGGGRVVGREAGDGRPADPDPPLAGLADEEADHDHHLLAITLALDVALAVDVGVGWASRAIEAIGPVRAVGAVEAAVVPTRDPAQQVGEQVGLGGAGRCGGHRRGRRHDLGQEHRPSMAGGPSSPRRRRPRAAADAAPGPTPTPVAPPGDLD